LLTIRVCLMSILPKLTLYAYLCLFVLIHSIGVLGAFWHVCSVLKVTSKHSKLSRRFLQENTRRKKVEGKIHPHVSSSTYLILARVNQQPPWLHQLAVLSIGWVGWFLALP
jgi:hypothetical protein